MNQTYKVWAQEKLALLVTKVKAQTQRLNGGIPYITNADGMYEDIGQKDIAWWTNGFWGGLLWQLYHYTNNSAFKNAAVSLEERLDKALFDYVGLHHDVGFMWLHTAVAHYRLDKNPVSCKRALHAANLLAGRFNIDGKFIVAWNEKREGWTIIDSMMNIPLLYWASKETGDPRFEKIAVAHAHTIAKYVIRENGSSGHIGSFDPHTGAFIEQIGGQGYAADSAWARGNAWALYGFAISYRHTKDTFFLNITKKLANWFIANVSQTGYVTEVDFCAPKIDGVVDTSAGLIAACGLLELANHLPENESGIYRGSAVSILMATESGYADWNMDKDSVIQGGTEAYHKPETYHVPLIYSDYFFAEGLLRLIGEDFFLW